MGLIIIITAIVSLLAGTAVSFYIIKRSFKERENSAKSKARQIIKEAESQAEVLKKDKLLEAKEKFIQLKTEHERELIEKNKAVVNAEGRIKQKESSLSQKIEQTQRKQSELETSQQNLAHQLELIEKRKEELERVHQRQVTQLEKIAGLSAEQAKAQMVDALKAESKTEAMSLTISCLPSGKISSFFNISILVHLSNESESILDDFLYNSVFVLIYGPPSNIVK